MTRSEILSATREALIAAEAQAAHLERLLLRPADPEPCPIADRQRWLDLTSLRNILVHDYPVSTDTLLRHVAAARADAPALLSMLVRLGGFLRKEGLFE